MMNLSLAIAAGRNLVIFKVSMRNVNQEIKK